MSTNGSPAAEVQAKKTASAAPKSYAKWFHVEFRDVIIDATLDQRKEAIEAYYRGYTAGCNATKGKEYSVQFEWTAAVSAVPDCQHCTLHVYVTPPPTFHKAAASTLAAASMTTLEDSKGQIDPPTPPPPPPPTM